MTPHPAFPAPILTRWHRSTGTPRTCLVCGTTRDLTGKSVTQSVAGGMANLCGDCRWVGRDPKRPRVMRVTDWSGAREEVMDIKQAA